MASYDVAMASDTCQALLPGDVERALAAEAEAILAEVVSRVPPSALMAGTDTASGFIARPVSRHSLFIRTLSATAATPACHCVLTMFICARRIPIHTRHI